MTLTSRSRYAVAGAFGLALATLFGTPLTSAVAAPGPVVVAHNLDNPRLLSFGPDGTLYVAESGRGGTASCQVGPEGGSVCYGTTGAITQVRHGHQSRLFSGLPSIGDEGTGGSALGPSQFFMGEGGRWSMTIGGGIDSQQRAALPASASIMTGLLSGRLGEHESRAARRAHSWWHTTFADLGQYEWNHNPDNSKDDAGNPTRDSDPQGFAPLGDGHYVVADAGGNTLLKVGRHGRIRTLAVFAPTDVPSPFGPFTMSAQAVPTAVVVGPDGAYYVSQLTGFPFAPNEARIFRVVPGQAPTVYASGLTNVTSLAWKGHTLYAVQISDGGLFGTGPIGSLIKVTGTKTTILGGLFAPYGLAIRHGSAYVSTCAVCAGDGQVIKVPLS